MRPSIRQATLHDAPGIAGVLADQGVVQVVAEPPALTESRLRSAIRLAERDGAAHGVFVAEAGGELLGFVAVSWVHNLRTGLEGMITDLFVHSRHRGQGAGTLLLERVEGAARERGCARLLLLNGRNGESYARAFYAGRGWDEHPELACFMRNLPPA